MLSSDLRGRRGARKRAACVRCVVIDRSERDGPAAGEGRAQEASPDLVERCRTELARCIGPMADYIVEDILSQTPHVKPEQLVQAIAAEIPNRKQAEEFQQKLRSR